MQTDFLMNDFKPALNESTKCISRELEGSKAREVKHELVQSPKSRGVQKALRTGERRETAGGTLYSCVVTTLS